IGGREPAPSPSTRRADPADSPSTVCPGSLQEQAAVDLGSPILPRLATAPGGRDAGHRRPLASAGSAPVLACGSSRSGGGRPYLSPEVCELIRTMYRENRLW